MLLLLLLRPGPALCQPRTAPLLVLQAKDLVEGSPCVILQKVKREDAVKMIEKLKTDTGAEFELV